MIDNRCVLRTVYAGMFVVASLALGVSMKTGTAILGQNGAKGLAQASKPPAVDQDSFPDYDMAAGVDFLVSATPRHLANFPGTADGNTGFAGRAGDTDRNVETCRSAAAVHHSLVGIFSESLTPAQASVDDTTAATEDRSSLILPVELTLVPGTYPLAAVPNYSSENASQSVSFNAVNPDGGTDALQLNPDGGFDFEATQSGPATMDLACRLYTPLTTPEPSPYELMGLETAGWALPAPSSGH